MRPELEKGDKVIVTGDVKTKDGNRVRVRAGTKGLLVAIQEEKNGGILVKRTVSLKVGIRVHHDVPYYSIYKEEPIEEETQS
jgi:phage repressor protein C with HTH and peptisase S24 domain